MKAVLFESLFGEPSPNFPPGTVGVWLLDKLISSPRAVLPNEAVNGSPSTNLFTGSRRVFANSDFWSATGLTITDANASAGDGTNDASTIAGSGTWFLEPYSSGSAIQLPAGDYTLAISVRWKGTGNQQFKLGEFNTSQLQTKTATGTLARYSAPIVSTGGSYRPIMITPDGSSSVSFEICDSELFPGTSDLGPVGPDKHLYLTKDGNNAYGVNLTGGGLIDTQSAKSTGLIQLPSGTSFSACTLIMVGEKLSPGGSGFSVYFGDLQDWTQFGFGTDIGTTYPGAKFHGSAIGQSQADVRLFDLIGDGLAALVHTYDGATALSYANDVRLLSNSITESAVNVADILIGAAVNRANYAGYGIFGFALWDRALSQSEIVQAVRLLVARVSRSGLSLGTSAQKTYIALGDSIAFGDYGSPGYAYKIAGNVSPRVRGVNDAIEGAHVSHMVAINGEVLPKIASATKRGRTCVCSVLLGANDLAGATDGTAFLTALASYLDTLRTAGAKVIAHTVLPRTFPTVIDDTVRATVNTTIRSWVGVHCDAVADFAADPTMGADGASDSATYYLDKLHPTDAGHTILETIERAAVDSF